MKLITKTLISGAFASLAATAVADADLIGTVIPAGNGSMLEIGVTSSEALYGLQFDIKAPHGHSFKGANIDGCLGGLPAAFSASSCTVIDEKTLRVVVLSLSGAELPDGFVGTVQMGAPDRNGRLEMRKDMELGVAASRGFSFENVIFGGQSGRQIEAGLVDFANADQSK